MLMIVVDKAHITAALLTGALLGSACGAASAAVRIEGRVDAGGGAVERSTVTLWAATAGEPRRLAKPEPTTKAGSNCARRRTPGGMSFSIWSPKAAKLR